ncbi:MAG TPA: GlsB/YeaQ/YmgE family stress response membrane protein [Xanthobacteraceae bacterium]|nr:GlsB/YeaQ/YmgE family stress response membrane protein [Xanthobacteraceae bacterium]
MHLSNEGILVILFVGLVAGWLAGEIMRGYGFGLVGDIIIGIIGAFIGDWLLPRLGIHLGVGLISAIVNATIGAVVLLLIIRLINGSAGWGWRRGYYRRW